jgi:hypothetical protein
MSVDPRTTPDSGRAPTAGASPFGGCAGSGGGRAIWAFAGAAADRRPPRAALRTRLTSASLLAIPLATILLAGARPATHGVKRPTTGALALQ